MGCSESQREGQHTMRIRNNTIISSSPAIYIKKTWFSFCCGADNARQSNLTSIRHLGSYIPSRIREMIFCKSIFPNLRWQIVSHPGGYSPGGNLIISLSGWTTKKKKNTVIYRIEIQESIKHNFVLMWFVILEAWEFFCCRCRYAVVDAWLDWDVSHWLVPSSEDESFHWSLGATCWIN